MAVEQNDLMKALKSVHQIGLMSDPSQAQAGGDPSAGGSDPSAAGGDPTAQGGTEQAVWTEFPGTDPQAVQQIAQGGDLAAALSQLLQAQDADRQKLDQMHDQLTEQLLQMFSGPQGGQDPNAGGMPPQAPGVGGEGGGY